MFLKKLDSLEEAFQDAGEDTLERGLPYLETLSSFSKVVEACFGNELRGNPGPLIMDFKSKYLSLGITVTPKVNSLKDSSLIGLIKFKVHIVFQHIMEYLEFLNKGAKISVGMY